MNQTIQQNIHECPGRKSDDSRSKKRAVMKAAGIVMRGMAWLIVAMMGAMLAIPSVIPAQETGQPQHTDKFKNEELAQMVASIALYPDSLIADILMASTYPLEVVEAERWLRQNKALTDAETGRRLSEPAGRRHGHDSGIAPEGRGAWES